MKTAPPEAGRPDTYYERLPDDIRNIATPTSFRWVVDAMEREAAFLLEHAAQWSAEDAQAVAKQMRPRWEAMAAGALREAQLAPHVARAIELLSRAGRVQDQGANT